MGRQTLSRDISLSLPSLLRRRVSGGASVAQWIERWTHDRKVGGSNPTCAAVWFFSLNAWNCSINKYN